MSELGLEQPTANKAGSLQVERKIFMNSLIQKYRESQIYVFIDRNTPIKIAVNVVFLVATMLDGAYASAKVLEEVVVTAQRRAEKIQDVAVAVTSASGEQLEQFRVSNIENIGAISSSVSFDKTNNASSSSNIQIRGIGTSGNSRTFEGAVGIFIDGVYRSRSGQALSQFLDIQQLQVLRGPQGTLFGKNTAAGAILLDSISPKLARNFGGLTLEVGNFDYYLARGVINIALGEKTALRFAGVETKRDGYLDNPNGGSVNDSNDTAVKAQFLFQPNDSLKFRIVGDSSETNDDCCYGTNDEVDGSLQWLIDSLSMDNGLILPSKDRDDFEAVVNPQAKNDVEDQGLSVYMTWEQDSTALNYVGADRSYELAQLGDGDFSGATIFMLNESFLSEFMSHELTFSGNIHSAFSTEFIIGIYYSSEDLKMSRNIYWGSQAQDFWDVVFGEQGIPPGIANASPGELTRELMHGTADSYALFSHWNITLNEKYNVILGARYTRDEKEGGFVTDNFRDPVLDPLALAGVMPGINYIEDFDDNSVSGNISVQYFHSDEAMAYFAINRGYKSGGINIDVNAAGIPGSPLAGVPAQISSPAYDSETIDAYEIGFKTEWLEGRARTNAALFYNDISNLQIAQFLGLKFNIENAPKGKVYGFEMEGNIQMDDTIELLGSVTWLSTAEYGDDDVLQHLAGRDFPNSPELAANITLVTGHTTSLGLKLLGRLEANYRDKVFTNTANNLKEGDLTLLNVSIGIESNKNGNWKALLFGQNLTNKDYVTQHFNTPLQGDDRNGYVGSPRTYGISLTYSF